VIHSAGLSSTGDRAIDSMLPLPEYYEVPEQTWKDIKEAQKNGKRIVALGTSVTRSIESAVLSGESKGLTSLKINALSDLKVITSLVTGMHEEGSSHSQLMQAFCSVETLSRAEREAESRDYASHEFGDLTLIERNKTREAS
jgi:S-adenosylmethionine:tRNA ribosyltransferase-isomerase